MKTIRLYISFLIISIFSGYLQAANLDSLLNAVNTTKSSEQAQLFNQIARAYIPRNVDTCIFYINKALKAAETNDQPHETAQAYLYFAVIKKRQNNLEQANSFYQKVIDSFKDVRDTALVSKAYNGLAQIEFSKGNLYQAIDYLKKTIELKEKINDKRGEGIAYQTLGNVYGRLSENDKAIENFQIAMKLFREINDLKSISANLNSIGILYENLSTGNDTNNLSEALKYYLQALDINREIKNLQGMAEDMSNIGNIHAQFAEFFLNKIENHNYHSKIQLDSLLLLKNKYIQKSRENYDGARKIQEQLNNVEGIITAEINLGALSIIDSSYAQALTYFQAARKIIDQIDSPPYLTSLILYYDAQANMQLGNYNESLKLLEQSVIISEDADIKKTLMQDMNLLTDVYDSLGRYKDALSVHRRYAAIKDSIFTEETNNLSQEWSKRYRTKEKEQLLQAKEAKLKQQQIENKQQRLMLYGLGIIIIFVVVFIFLIFRQYRQKKRANEVLEAKNLLITQQKQEITDSIQYAQYIQLAVLPQLTSISSMMVDHFILFRPRDIVSGDFYWMKEMKASNSLMITAADCTGHGVPGAFMSLLGISFLNEITSHRGLDSPGLILDQLKQKVIDSLHQTEEVGSSHDGMDMSFVVVNKNEKQIKYAGANNPLYIIRSNEKPPLESEKMIQGDTHTLYEIKADKMPIGISHASDAKFTTHTIDYLEGDTIYLFSDGYADQFGGEKYKKLKYAPFKKMLLANINLPMDEQKQEIEELHLKWKGNMEQTDDIIVIGIRL